MRYIRRLTLAMGNLLFFYLTMNKTISIVLQSTLQPLKIYSHILCTDPQARLQNNITYIIETNKIHKTYAKLNGNWTPSALKFSCVHT